MEIIDIGCPRSIDLSSVIHNDKDTKSILQTINIYDHVIISQNIKNKENIFIKSNNISQTLYEKLNELLLLYSNYVGLIINNISVELKYDINYNLKQEENMLAGFVLALNYYFKNNVTNHELIYLTSKIDPLISYYINGGYKKIDKNSKMYNIGNNPYNKYYLFDNINNIDDIKQLLDKNNIVYSNNNFITSKNIINSGVIINLKRLIPNINISVVENVKEHKVLVKYIK